LSALQKLYNCTKANGAYFELKKYVSSSCVFNFKKNSVLKLLDRTLYTPMELILKKKRYVSSSCVFDF
jgi:hypothetical protein